MPRLILASTSPYRRAQLEQLRVPFDAMAPDVNEDAAKSLGLAPRELAERLAVQKGEAIARDHPQAIVIGGDQLVSIENHILGKPQSVENAIEQLLRLSGRPHDLITAVSVSHRGSTETHIDQTRLRMRPIDRAAARRYVLADDPLDCAGAYKIESLGISLFEQIETEDHTAITGLPLLAVSRMLNNLGLVIP